MHLLTKAVYSGRGKMGYRTKIIGAGSVGNHITNASQKLDQETYLCDVAPEALERTKNHLYPLRYGQKLGDDVTLCHPDELVDMAFDLCVVGTPPETHMAIAIDELSSGKSKNLLIEKPLCHHDDPRLDEFLKLAKKSETKIYVGYCHNIAPSTQKMIRLIKQGVIGRVVRVDANIKESIKYILKAHPWLSTEKETYLGYFDRGGGAAYEHSHGIAFWLNLLRELNIPVNGNILGNLMFDKSQNTEMSLLFAKNDCSFSGGVYQDFFSTPPLKKTTVIGTLGQISWAILCNKGMDIVTVETKDEIKKYEFKKERASDFINELSFIKENLHRNVPYGLSLQLGLDVIKMIETTYKSHHDGHKKEVDL